MSLGYNKPLLVLGLEGGECKGGCQSRSSVREAAGSPLMKLPWDCGVTVEDARPCDLTSQPVWPCWGKGVEGTLRQNDLREVLCSWWDLASSS